MMGMRLLELDACDALDVIHVLLEEDIINRSSEEAEAKDRIRGIIYGDMYQMESWRKSSMRPRTPPTADGAEPSYTATTKPYMPPTDPGQLASVLGPPMG